MKNQTNGIATALINLFDGMSSNQGNLDTLASYFSVGQGGNLVANDQLLQLANQLYSSEAGKNIALVINHYVNQEVQRIQNRNPQNAQ